MPDSTMTQTDAAGHIWEGKINQITKVGLHKWRGQWEKDDHRLMITITDIAKKQIDIWEMQPEQHWIGTYEQFNDKLEIEGTLLNGNLSYSSILYLPEPPMAAVVADNSIQTVAQPEVEPV